MLAIAEGILIMTHRENNMLSLINKKESDLLLHYRTFSTIIGTISTRALHTLGSTLAYRDYDPLLGFVQKKNKETKNN